MSRRTQPASIPSISHFSNSQKQQSCNPRKRRSARDARLQRAIWEPLEVRQLLSVGVYTVNNPTDTPSAGSLTLRQAIGDANTDGNTSDTINFASNVTGTIALTSGLIEISQNVNIVGPGASSLAVSGNNNSAIFTVDDGAVVSITNLTLTKGNDTTGNGGGAILNNGGLSLSGVTVSNSTTSTNGGAIYNFGVLSIVNSDFFGNSTVNGTGGAIDNENTLTVTDSSFTTNSAQTGGGIYNDGALTVTIDILSDNTAADGGGLFNYGGATITDSEISNNTATFTNGGGIDSESETTIINSTIADNTAVGYGGGIYGNYSVTATNVTVADNLAQYGGGIYVAIGGDSKFDNSIIANNSSYAGNVDVDGGPLDSSSAYNLIGVAGSSGLTTGENGNKVNVAADLGTLQNNGGPTETVALLSGSPAINAGDNSLATDANGNLLVTDQRGDFRIVGGAVDMGAYEYASTTPASLVVTPTGDFLTVNTTADFVAYTPGLLTLRQAVGFANFEDNSNTTIQFDSGTFSAPDTTITLDLGPLNFTNQAASTTVDGPGENILTISGDGATQSFSVVNVYYGATATLMGLTMTDGHNTGVGTDGGGAIYSAGTLTIDSALFTGNSSEQDGGAIDNGSTGVLTLNEVNFTDNTTEAKGGALHNRGILTDTDSTFTSNSANSGVGGAIYDDGTITVSDSSISGNSAGGGGGVGIDGSATLIDDDIFGNTATFANLNTNSPNGIADLGGGVFSSGQLQISDTSIFNNFAEQSGGGLYSGGTTNIINSTFAGNNAMGGLGNGGGGGIYNEGILVATNATIAGNSAAIGGGMFLNGDTTIYNTIVASNTFTASSTASDVGGGGSFDAVSASNLIGAGGSGGLTDGSDGNQVGVVDPLLAALGNYGGPTETMPPLPGSTAIDEGSSALVPSGVTLDQRGEPRIFGASVDIGAVEIQGYKLTWTPMSESTTTGSLFGQALVVTITPDDPLDPVNGGVITYIAPTSGASASLSTSDVVTTNTFTLGATIASNQTTVWATANGTVGSYTVNASTTGSTTTAAFMLTNMSPTTVKASSTVSTTASNSSVTLGTSTVTLSDSATLSGGTAESGSITFMLYLNGTLVNTQSVAVSGNGVYDTPTGYMLPESGSVNGTYLWVATYSGDNNNLPSTDNDPSNEQTVVTPASPTISTSPNGNSVALGTSSQTLTDTATLSGGYFETGSITFMLYGPSGLLDTETVSVNGNGSYTTPLGYPLPATGAAVGTYQWDATYNSGDGNNNSASEDGATSEQVTVNSASPTITTTASSGVTLGTATPTLSDSAVVANGYNESGNLVFTLTGPDGFSYTQTDVLSGNGTYTASDTLPTTGIVAGTYTWSVSYVGDASNNGATDQGGSAEQTVVSKANPTITTTASSAVTLGTTAPTLSDSAVFAAGYFETGSLLFTLSGPGGFSYTQTDTLTGNGTYTASDALPTSGTVAGTYTWSVSYIGDANNNSATDQGGSAEQTMVSKASPAIVTTASSAVTLGTTAPTLSDSAVLSAGYYETGSLVFNLTGPGGFSYTQTDTLTGNGTYTASDALPTTGTVAGAYTWHVTYVGDANNNSASDQGGSTEQTVVSKASPAIVTTASSAVTLGTTAPTLSDSAVLSAGYYETGSLVFNLTGPGGFSYTQTDTLAGNGTYSASDALPTTGTVAGAYTWHVTYVGDANNNSAADQGGSTEQTVVSPANPTITTTPNASSITLGSSSPTLKDTAMLAAGYFETGSIQFTLYGPNNALLDTETVSVNGNGAYTTPTGYTLPSSGTLTGTYQWDATYIGDANNNPASENNSPSERTSVGQAGSSVSTTIDDASTHGTPTGTLAEEIYDTATVNGGFATPTGSVTYYFFNTGSPVFGTTTPASTQTVTLVGGSVPASSVTGELPAGTYSYIAVYSGDSNYAGSMGPVETVTINKGTLTLVTTIHDSGGGAPTGTLGESVYDTYSLSGSQPFAFTGTVNYLFDGSNAGSGSQSNTESTLAAGSYNFQANSTGDSNYVVNTSALEPLTINKGTLTLVTTIDDATTHSTPTGTLGESVYDTYTLSGNQPIAFTGTVNYLFDGSNAGSGSQSITESTLAAGSYNFQANSTGDSNYVVNTSALEPLTINKGTLTLVTTIDDSTSHGAPTGALGETVYDTYSLSGSQPIAFSGTVNYLFDGSGIASSGANSVNEGPLQAGSYNFQASSSGDSNYVVNTSAIEPLTINKGTLTLTTTIDDSTSHGTPTGSLGESVYDTSTLNGSQPFAFTGSVNYTFNGNGAGAGAQSSTEGPLQAGSYTFLASSTGDSNYVVNSSAPESLTIKKGTLTLTTTIDDATSHNTPTGALGESVYDTSALNGSQPFAFTGSVNYTFNGNSAGTGAQSSTEGPLQAGSYTFLASSTGDSNYVVTTSAPESLTINKGTLALTTTIHDSGGGTPTGALGEKVYDTYSLIGSQPFAFNGSINYTFNGNSAGSGSQSTTEGPLQAGGYTFLASSAGDSNYVVTTSAPESLTINKGTLTLTTTIDDASTHGTPTGALGESVYDTSSLSGSEPFAFTGTVSYLFDGGSAGSGSQSTTEGPLHAGSYTFQATSTGDSNYVVNSSAVEPLTINKGTLGLVTTIHDSGGGTPTDVAGESVYDTATVTGQVAGFATGTVSYTFQVGSGTLAAAGTGTQSSTEGPLSAGSYKFQASVAGNSDYVGATSAVEPLTISKASPTISTTPGGTVTLGSGTKMTDSATLAGGYADSGSLVFSLVNSSNTTVYTDTVTVTGNGTFSTSSGNNAGGYLPTAAGTYQWVVTYGGDSNNNGVTSPAGSEPEVANSAGNITISGTKFLDCTGNGFTSDDTGLGGVTIDLYLNSNGGAGLQTGSGGDTLVASTVTASNGTYSFNNLTPGTYFVTEVVPSGYVQTGGGPNGSAGATYYTINATNNQTYTGNNFDDYMIPTCTPTCVSYTVYSSSCGYGQTFSTLSGNTQQGDVVTVNFTVTPGMTDQLTLVSYTAPSSTFSTSNAYEQQIYDDATGVFGPGQHCLTVVIPNCYYQIDFICGPAINQFGPPTGSPDNANLFYYAEDRHIDADNGGTAACTTKPVCNGTFATAGYWTTTTGQNVIKCLNGGSSSTCLAQWLCTSFPNLYGSGCGTHSLCNSNGTYFTNSQVAAACSKFTGGDLQCFSAALSTYCTSTNLAGCNIRNTDSHFTTSAYGSGMYTYSVGTNGAAFGVANYSTCTILQMLTNLNNCTTPGSSVSTGANTCFSSVNTTGNVSNDDLSVAGVAFTPAQIRDAYGINDLSFDGTGQTIAIVDAYDNPDIAQALDTFDTQFSATDSGPSLYDQYGAASSFLTVLNQAGQTGAPPVQDPTGNWEAEEELDVEWAHAIAPGAQIVLVEANSDSLSDLMSSVATASVQPGVSVVSMSWGFAEGQSVSAADEAYFDQTMTTPGVTYLASTGDWGSADPEYPAFSPNVVAVGGTSLTLNSDNSYNSETGWGYFSNSVGEFIGSGGGVSQFESEPSYQAAFQATGYRTTPDVSMDADPATGAYITDPYNITSGSPFEVVGGTSLSAPLWGGLMTLVNQGRAQAGQPTLNSGNPTDAQQAIYTVSSNDFNQIGGGYNTVTGLGSPIANLLVPDLIAHDSSTDAPAPAASGAIPTPSDLTNEGDTSIQFPVSDAIIESRLTAQRPAFDQSAGADHHSLIEQPAATLVGPAASDPVVAVNTRVDSDIRVDSTVLSQSSIGSASVSTASIVIAAPSAAADLSDPMGLLSPNSDDVVSTAPQITANADVSAAISQAVTPSVSSTASQAPLASTLFGGAPIRAFGDLSNAVSGSATDIEQWLASALPALGSDADSAVSTAGNLGGSSNGSKLGDNLLAAGCLAFVANIQVRRNEKNAKRVNSSEQKKN
jgi:Prealbumin-like fold domain